jgi:hypothetical protein
MITKMHGAVPGGTAGNGRQFSPQALSEKFTNYMFKSQLAPGAVMAAENRKGRGIACTVHTENRTAVRADIGNSHSRKKSQEEQPV